MKVLLIHQDNSSSFYDGKDIPDSKIGQPLSVAAEIPRGVPYFGLEPVVYQKKDYLFRFMINNRRDRGILAVYEEV